MFLLYSFLLTVGFILMLPIFLLKREKYAAGFWQRMGYLPAFEKDARRVVWLHCVSVGETNAARPLVEEIRRRFPEHRLIVSTTTKTGQHLAREIFREKAETIFYFPFDWKFTVRRALKHFEPDLILLVETEIWFRFLREASRAGAKTAIVNGRLSEKSFRNFSKIAFFMRRVLGFLDLALMQTEPDAARLKRLGIAEAKVKVTGNIKFDQSLAANDLTADLRARFAVDGRAPLILAASTHEPEEKWILAAFRKVSEMMPERNARLLIAPRHPERFAAVAELVAGSGFQWARRSQEETPADRAARVILLDSIGELRAAYPLADLVFVGGSLVPHGGQSVLEPAAAARAIVTGPYTMNFSSAVAEFLRRDALIQLTDADEQSVVDSLTRIFAELLQDERRRASLGHNALVVMEQNRGAAARTIEHLKAFLQ